MSQMHEFESKNRSILVLDWNEIQSLRWVKNPYHRHGQLESHDSAKPAQLEVHPIEWVWLY